MLPQEPVLALDPTMGLLPQVEEGWLAGGKEARSRARDALARLGLAGRERHFPHQLSGGMAQRAAFAAATLGQARLLIADEPTKGLDSRASARLQTLLQGYLTEGRHLLTITHDLSWPGRWGLGAGGQGGEVVEQGPAEQVLHTPSHAYSRALLAAEPSAWPEAVHPPTGDWLLRGRGSPWVTGSRLCSRAGSATGPGSGSPSWRRAVRARAPSAMCCWGCSARCGGGYCARRA